MSKADILSYNCHTVVMHQPLSTTQQLYGSNALTNAINRMLFNFYFFLKIFYYSLSLLFHSVNYFIHKSILFTKWTMMQ